MTKTVYLYDDANEFSGTYEAHESPETAGEYITPKQSTDIQPPTLEANQAAFFEGGLWVAKIDYRGYVGYDTSGDIQEITVVGVTPDVSWTTIAPPVIPASVSMRQARLALHANGQLTTIQAALDGLGDAASLIEWEYATKVDRASALTTQMAAVLSLNEAGLDALFTQAAAI